MNECLWTFRSLCCYCRLSFSFNCEFGVKGLVHSKGWMCHPSRLSCFNHFDISSRRNRIFCANAMRMPVTFVRWLGKNYTCYATVRGLRILPKTMHKAYLRYVDGSESFQLCLNVSNSTLKVDREFNFSRQVTESVGSLLNRINNNIGKVVEKKNKKKQKKETGKEEKESDNSESASVCTELQSNGVPVPLDNICKDVLFENHKLCLVVSGIEYEIIVNCPWVNGISLPTNIMAGFPVYPSKYEVMFSERNKSMFKWYRSSANKGEDWIEVGSNYYYNPTTDDIGHLLKFRCIPGNGTTEGPPYDVTSNKSVQAGPGQCPFEMRHVFTSEHTEWPVFRVVSYNILADLYADSDVAREQLYPYCPAYALEGDYRKQLICKEVMGYNADIMCLQEVDQKVFTHDLQPLLSHLDFEGIFTKKGGQVSEGLACFFHKSKFRFVDSHSFCLADELSKNSIFADLWEKLKDNTNFMKRFSERTTSVQVTVLQSICNSKEVLIVGNTHLYFHPDADHIRLFQAGMIIRFLEHLRDNLISSTPDVRVSIVLCGDFNSTPECGVYQLMTTRHVAAHHKDWGSNADEAIHDLSLSLTTQLKSACGTPEITNFTVGFFGCLDYIFYQSDHISVSQVIPFPSQEELTHHTALPSVVFPSDHVALVCDLKLFPM